jgi:hypothetical protein
VLNSSVSTVSVTAKQTHTSEILHNALKQFRRKHTTGHYKKLKLSLTGYHERSNDDGNTTSISTVHVTIYMAVCEYDSNAAYPHLDTQTFMALKYC